MSAGLERIAPVGRRTCDHDARFTDGQVAGWLGRLITRQIDIEPMLPYRTEGATALFFGRDHEVRRLIGPGCRGGVILGVHQSGKSSLLHELRQRLASTGRTVVGPLTLDTDQLASFLERTLELIDPAPSAAKTPTSWAKAIRAFAKTRGAPVFLLDEVDGLVQRDAETGHPVGRAIRALQQDHHADFYLAGHLGLRAAVRKYGSPFRNVADEVVLTGLTRDAARRLICEPIQGIGFEITDDQADRIFQGTAGMAKLIQEFCRRMLMGLRGHSDNVISDALIARVEETPAYLDGVFHYFHDYGQTTVSRALFLLTAVAEPVTRGSILKLLRERGVALAPDRIDDDLTLLASFGILDQSAPGSYRIPGSYLRRAIAVRDPNTLLAHQIAVLRETGGDDDPA